jgi:REP element-mobilizing transposase RayT
MAIIWREVNEETQEPQGRTEPAGAFQPTARPHDEGVAYVEPAGTGLTLVVRALRCASGRPARLSRDPIRRDCRRVNLDPARKEPITENHQDRFRQCRRLRRRGDDDRPMPPCGSPLRRACFPPQSQRPRPNRVGPLQSPAHQSSGSRPPRAMGRWKPLLAHEWSGFSGIAPHHYSNWPTHGRAQDSYHVTARGAERRANVRDDLDGRHFLQLLGELAERFGTRVHGWVLLDNHFHLPRETPEPYLSQTGQCLNVSYSVWFHRRHQRSGHLFQGRFSAAGGRRRG